jgi:hypothetical protein
MTCVENREKIRSRARECAQRFVPSDCDSDVCAPTSIPLLVMASFISRSACRHRRHHDDDAEREAVSLPRGPLAAGGLDLVDCLSGGSGADSGGWTAPPILPVLVQQHRNGDDGDGASRVREQEAVAVRLLAGRPPREGPEGRGGGRVLGGRVGLQGLRLHLQPRTCLLRPRRARSVPDDTRPSTFPFGGRTPFGFN